MLVADRRTGKVTHTGSIRPIEQDKAPCLRDVERAMQALRALHGTGSRKHLDVIARFLNLKEDR